MNNRQNGRRRGRGGQQARNGQPGLPDRGSRVDNRARGNAAQLLEKYKSLARDAQMAGDRVNTEYYLQFADHYFRVLSENRSRFEEQRPEQRRRDEYRDEFSRAESDGFDGDDAAGDEDGAAPAPVADAPRREVRAEPQPAPPVAPPPVRRERAPREEVELPPAAAMADEGERFQERRPRRSRTPRNVDAAPAPSVAAAAPEAERIEADRLPQGFGTPPAEPVAAEGEAPAPAPRRRAPRRPRAEAPVAEA